jgi:hypothetical protein
MREIMELTLTAQEPIVHGEFSDGVDIGNMMNFRQMPMLVDSGTISVPVISGNAIRGILRRFLAREVVDTFKLRESLDRKAFDKLYIAIANGGNLDKSMDVDVDTERIRAVRQSFPMLSLFGAALYKYMLPGMCSVGFAIPHCKELGTGDISANDLVHDIGLTRHLDKTVANPGEAKPMPYTVETMISGSVFDVKISLEPQATGVEEACLNHGLKLLTHIGGKSAAGFGAVSVDGYGDDAEYVEWLQNPDNAETLIKFAEEL